MQSLERGINLELPIGVGKEGFKTHGMIDFEHWTVAVSIASSNLSEFWSFTHGSLEHGGFEPFAQTLAAIDRIHGCAPLSKHVRAIGVPTRFGKTCVASCAAFSDKSCKTLHTLSFALMLPLE